MKLEESERLEKNRIKQISESLRNKSEELNSERDKLRKNAENIGCALSDIAKKTGIIYDTHKPFIIDDNETDSGKDRVTYTFSIERNENDYISFWIIKRLSSCGKTKGEMWETYDTTYYNFSNVGIDIIESAMYSIGSFLEKYLSLVEIYTSNTKNAVDKGEEIKNGIVNPKYLE